MDGFEDKTVLRQCFCGSFGGYGAAFYDVVRVKVGRCQSRGPPKLVVCLSGFLRGSKADSLKKTETHGSESTSAWRWIAIATALCTCAHFGKFC